MAMSQAGNSSSSQESLLLFNNLNTKGVKKMAKALSKPESNLKKLTKSPIPMNFVKKHNASWNHQDWLDFLDYLKEKNYFPIDTDKVGLLLEEKKAQYIALKNK